MEPGLTLYTSNRLDVLVERLADLLGREPLPPLEQEIVVVQSQGMQRWTTLELARLHGIAGSLSTPFPRPFARYLADRVLDRRDLPPSEAVGRGEASLFARGILTWRLFGLLGRAMEKSEEAGALAVPAAYLADDGDQRRRYQLATRLGSLFDDYQIFRPDLLSEWQQGAADVSDSSMAGWQGVLWRRLVSEATERDEPEAPFSDRLRRLVTRLRHGATPRGLPRRLTVLGVASLPPLFIDLLVALARHVPVRICFVSPTYHYWGDLRSERETSRLARRLRWTGGELEDAHFDEGNALLAGLGRQGRDFFNLLQRADATGDAWHELDFVVPEDERALHVLQRDVLDLHQRSPADRLPLHPDDDSLEIHVCHSPMREMEVLRDRLLRAFDRDADLRPHDVLVMVPDIEIYGPYIQAVFGAEGQFGGDTEEDGAAAVDLPFSIADRRLGRQQPPAEVLLDVLDLVGSRLPAAAVLSLLDTPAVARRFGIDGPATARIHRWVHDVRIRWGMDGDQRRRDFDVPGHDANTWRSGLDRLLMGHAVGDLETLAAGVAPHAGATAGDADALGRFADFVDALFRQIRILTEPRPLDGWAAALDGCLDALFLPDGDAEERGLQAARAAADELRSLVQMAAVDGDVDRRVIQEHLTATFAEDGFGSGFINGQLTFCATRPMRTIPFPVVCFAGLDDGAFPRRDPRRSFDLMAGDPRTGDRSMREDDRYLFLETLLAAGDRLILTYVGRSQRDGSPREPSTVLSELLDQLDRTFVPQDGGAARDAVTVEHPLQPWSSAYFDRSRPRLFSYSEEDASAAEALLLPAAPLPPFADAAGAEGGHPAPGAAKTEGEIEIEIDDLVDLWLHPSRHYCRRILGLAPEEDGAAVDDAEPFAVEGLDAYGARQWLVERRLGSDDAAGPGDPAGDASGGKRSPFELRWLQARGELPPGALGAALYLRLVRRAETFARRVPRHRRLEPPTVAVEGHGFRLVGRLQDATDIGPLSYRCARLRPRDRLRAWIEHLLRRAAETETSTPPRLIGEDREITFAPPKDSLELLGDLVAGYRLGLQGPLPFFEYGSSAYAERCVEAADPRRRAGTPPLDVARRAFEGERRPGRVRRPGDAEDPWVRLAFRGAAPLELPGFGTWAERIWRPLLEHEQESGP